MDHDFTLGSVCFHQLMGSLDILPIKLLFNQNLELAVKNARQDLCFKLISQHKFVLVAARAQCGAFDAKGLANNERDIDATNWRIVALSKLLGRNKATAHKAHQNQSSFTSQASNVSLEVGAAHGIHNQVDAAVRVFSNDFFKVLGIVVDGDDFGGRVTRSIGRVKVDLQVLDKLFLFVGSDSGIDLLGAQALGNLDGRDSDARGAGVEHEFFIVSKLANDADDLSRGKPNLWDGGRCGKVEFKVGRGRLFRELEKSDIRAKDVFGVCAASCQAKHLVALFEAGAGRRFFDQARKLDAENGGRSGRDGIGA